MLDKEIIVGDKIHRILAELTSTGILFNQTEHTVTQRFSASGMLIDNKHYKVYLRQIDIAKKGYVENGGIGAEIWLTDNESETVIQAHDALRENINQQLQQRYNHWKIYEDAKVHETFTSDSSTIFNYC